jgi:hypothetical protein
MVAVSQLKMVLKKEIQQYILLLYAARKNLLGGWYTRDFV